MRLLSLLAQGILVQAATVADGGVMEKATFSNRTGPIAASRLANLNFKTMETAPDFVDDLPLPAIPALLTRLKSSSLQEKPNMGNTDNTDNTNLAAASVDVRRAMQTEIQNSGLLKPVIAQSDRKYGEQELAEIFAAGVMISFDSTADGPPTGLAASPNGRRLLGFWGDLWDAITGAVKAVGCSAFATGALPGYLVAYGLFHSGNSGYNKLSSHQKYFARAGGFDSDLLNTVNVKYSAWFAPGFSSAGGVTMGSEIYIRNAKTDMDTRDITDMALPSAFVSQLRLLMHEMGHSKQYEARNWGPGKFGWKYLYEFCKAGMSYSKNSMEKDAETYRDNSDALMKAPVTAHFKKWRKDNLAASVGFSKSATEYSNFQIGNTKIMSLDYTKVTSKLAESQRKAGTNCVRVLTGSQLNSRTQAEVSGKPWDCVNVKPTKPPTRKPTKAPTRKPTAKPTPKPTAKPTLKPTAKPTINPFVGDFPIGTATRPPTFKIGTFSLPPTLKIPLDIPIPVP